MSTNADIIMQDEDGYHAIYLHWDGYPSHALETLQKYYTDRELVEQMISLGDMSILDNSIEKPEGHTYENRIKGYSIFYNRDRNEEWEDTKPYFATDLNECRNNQYSYLFTLDGEWKVV